jgi:Flp pilus assembly protein TadD
VMLLVDYAVRREWEWRRYLPVGIAALLAVGPIAMGLFAEGGISVDIEGDKRHYTIFTMFRVIPQYLGILLAPVALNNRYPLDVATRLGDWRVILGILILLGAAIFAIRAARRDCRWPVLCLGWFVLWWLPVSNILPTMTSMADRYLYLSAPGLFLALGIGLEKLGRPRQVHKVAVCVLMLLSLMAMQRTRVWQGPESLWTDCLAKTPKNRTALHNLGTYRVTKGDFAGGYPLLTALAEQGEDTARLWSNLGVCEMNFGKVAKAKDLFLRATALDPDNEGYWLNLAYASVKAGDFELARTILPRIEATMDQATFMDLLNQIVKGRRCDIAGPLIQRYRARWPGDFRGARMLGVCLAEAGQFDLAMQALEEAARLNPGDPATRVLIQKVQAAQAPPRSP